MEKIKTIYSMLLDKYYNYYCSVYYEFIIDAIKNTLKDNYNKGLSIEEIHNYIKENYI